MKAYIPDRLFNGTHFLNGMAVLTENNTIQDIIASDVVPETMEKQYLEGRLLAPACIDIQIYGGNGRLFSHELSAAAIQSAYEYCLAGGTAQFYITLATNAPEVIIKGIDAVRAYWQAGGKGMPGLHLEGPYLNPLKKGAHLEKYITRPATAELSRLLNYGRGVIKIMTLAPEQCDDAILQQLQEEGILVSAGHSNASYEEGMIAFDKGIKAATHLFNAMSGLQHRAPGLVGAIYEHPGVMSSIVPDGIHVDFAALRISKKLMQERLFIITDAVTAAAEGSYPHVYKGDRYTLPDGTLSGSALTMMKGVQNLIAEAGIEPGEALRMASLYPARVTGMDNHWGKIEKGYAAELVVLDNGFNVSGMIGS